MTRQTRAQVAAAKKATPLGATSLAPTTPASEPMPVATSRALAVPNVPQDAPTVTSGMFHCQPIQASNFSYIRLQFIIIHI